MATERRSLTRKQRIAILIMIALGLLMILIGILMLPHSSAAAAEDPPYNPVGVLFSIGVMCATVVDGRSMAVHDSLAERCQNCARFPGNNWKCEHDALHRKVVYALDYGCAMWLMKGTINESMLMRQTEEKPEIEGKPEEY
jgi:hypothetical protein